MSTPDFFDELERHLDRAAQRQARYGRLAAAPLPSATGVLAAVLVALVIGAGAYALPRLAGSENEVASPPTPRGPEAITVTPDLIRLGKGLVGESIAKSSGRLYVLAGHYEDETSTLFPSEEAVLVAFDEAGSELWRTELDGAPTEVMVVAGDPWIIRGARFGDDPMPVVKLDAEDGRVIGEAGIKVGDGGYTDNFLDAFGAVWVTRAGLDSFHPAEMVRMDPDDLSVTRLDVPLSEVECNNEDDNPAEWCPGEARAGEDAVWVPLKDDGVAMIDPATNDVTVIGAGEIGHQVQKVAVDGDVTYVASSDRVSSIVEGSVVATARVWVGGFTYLGQVDGLFGVLDMRKRRVKVLRPNHPMVVESRRVSMPKTPGIHELDGQAWHRLGRNPGFRRVEIVP